VPIIPPAVLPFHSSFSRQNSDFQRFSEHLAELHGDVISILIVVFSEAMLDARYLTAPEIIPDEFPYTGTGGHPNGSQPGKSVKSA
jgi:hypothetical protein